jgi:hypothetical protein
MKTVAHQGHMGNGGLQKHSVGEIYPWTIRGVGDTCQAFNCIDGRTGTQHPYVPNVEGSHAAAYALAMEDVQDFIAADNQPARKAA